jgi:predicted CoA-substrate-specific enzyme activase
MYYAGVDVGAITAKAAIVDERGLVGSAVLAAGYHRAEAARQVLVLALARAKLERQQIAALVATGYGRVQVEEANRTVTEITCHGRGAFWLCPDVRTVIDIGGQDSKGIALSAQGKVLDFVMNDKCAAGTGRFLEVMAHALEEDLAHFGELSLAAAQRVAISSTCTVFAESEIVTHIASGAPKPAIIAGIHDAIASRVAAMVARIPVLDVVMLTGGVAQNPGLVRMLEEKLGREIVVRPEAQITGAIGAALFARDMAERSTAA